MLLFVLKANTFLQISFYSTGFLCRFVLTYLTATLSSSVHLELNWMRYLVLWHTLHIFWMEMHPVDILHTFFLLHQSSGQNTGKCLFKNIDRLLLFGSSKSLETSIFSLNFIGVCGTTMWSIRPFMRIQNLVTILGILCITEKTSQPWRRVFADSIILWNTLYYKDEKIPTKLKFHNFLRDFGIFLQIPIVAIVPVPVWGSVMIDLCFISLALNSSTYTTCPVWPVRYHHSFGTRQSAGNSQNSEYYEI